MAQLSILVVDDDKNFCLSVRDYLRRKGHQVDVAHTGKDALQLFREKWYHIVLQDENLPDIMGHDLCPELLKINADLKIIFITAYPSFQHALQAIKAGAYDYLSKPFELGELDLSLANAARTIELEQEVDSGRYATARDQAGSALVGTSPFLAQLRGEVELLTGSRSPALITGETGTGKNVVARYLHDRSERRDKPFIVINCSAIPETLIEAELFGHERGAFTGAVKNRKGVFELASGGTLVLDEIGDMPLLLQSRLLTVLDSQVIRRVGGESPIPVDVRVIATTNTDLEQAVAAKKFRADLYYRLSVIRFAVPPLRQRPQDILPVCRHFLKLFNREAIAIDPEEAARLEAYDWPGNIRELRNIVERSLLLSRDGAFQPSALLSVAGREPSGPVEQTASPGGAVKTMEQVEHEHIMSVLRRCSNNKSQAAKALGISLSSLKRKVKEQ
ncbi:MAG: sigma-54 dependent transcriptional regulator [Candidatus Edwardsbacteria bacterium]|jgi:DNA-binding NtrC family response regulator|nr:sigma-54 dependent transcriptional regulator [Candidatus Edwardsbacteria bacterium]